MPKVKVSAFVTEVETRIIEITDEELAEFRAGRCDERIVDAICDDEGEYVERYTSGVQSDEWELIEEKATQS